MAKAGLRRNARAAALGAALVGASAAWAAAAPAWTATVQAGAGSPEARSDAAAPARAILPAVRFVPGSLLLPLPGPRPILRDSCGAASLAWLVGQPRSRIPVAVDLSHRRVACTACPVAPEVRLDRLDILYDARTGVVAKVTCG